MKPLPARRGALLALAAALLFGAGTPLVQRLGVRVGSLATASLLYAGAALAGALLQRPAGQEAGIGRRDGGRLVLVALCGAAAAPVALAWGLQRTSAISASLLLTLEAVFTAALARALHRETLGPRVALALALVTLGALTLILEQAAAGTTHLAGSVAVAAATALWALDNTLSRPLSGRDPGRVVLAKAALGALATALLAALFGEPLPGPGAAIGLLAVGATAYGFSLRLYLLAQRSFGAARTASVFACAPFAGALAALAMGDRPGSAWLAAGAVLTAAGVALHLAERHDHAHDHAALEHEHAHTHDDGHHDHVHATPPHGAHNHWHRHPPLRHSHPHVPDAHHDHRH